jgi:hypothetical protein
LTGTGERYVYKVAVGKPNVGVAVENPPGGVVAVGNTLPGVVLAGSAIASSVCAAAVYSGFSVAPASGVGFTPRLQAESRSTSRTIHGIVTRLFFIRTSISFQAALKTLSMFESKRLSLIRIAHSHRYRRSIWR